MIKKTILYFLSSILLIFSFQVFAQSQQLKEYLSNFQSMSADFNQNISAKKGPVKNSQGHMALLRPGKFRWEIVEPNHEIIIADGNYLWIYNEDLEQATKQKLDKSGNSPASLLSGSTDSIEQRFIVIKEKNNNNNVSFQLKPRSTKDMIQWIELDFTEGKLQQMSVKDNLGQKTVFNFSNIKLNPQLPSKLFSFQPPKNVDVVQN